MSRRIQFRRGTTAEHLAFIGAPGEITVDTDKNVVVIHDGSTPGGFPNDRFEDLSGNVTLDARLIIQDGTASTSNSTGALVVTGGLGVGGKITSSQIETNTLVETSSIDLKENINPITDGLDKILKLSGVIYDRKDKSFTGEAGLIAEEVEKVLPNIVVKDNENKIKGLVYTKIIAYLIEAIKEQQAQIDELKNRK